MRLLLPALCLALAACGQSGALYLPDTAPVAQPAAPAAAPEEKKEEAAPPAATPAPSTP